MSLFKGALTARRFVVDGAPPENFRAVYPDLLQDKAFREPTSRIARHAYHGWTMVQNLLDTDFTRLEGWLLNQYAILGLRIEQKRLPTKLLQATLKKRVQDWCEEHGRERAPASVRTEIKELLEDELLARTLPRVQHLEVCWNMAEGWLLILHASDAMSDLVKKHFRDTFGLALREAGPAAFLAEYAPAYHALEVLGATRLGLFPLPESQDPGDGYRLHADQMGPLSMNAETSAALPHMVTDFLLWIWWASERHEGRIDLGEEGGLIDFWIDDKIVTKAEDRGGRSALQSDQVAHERAAGAALASGQILSEARVGLRREGREYSVHLKGAGLTMVGAKLPTECKGSEDEVLYERMFLYEDLFWALGALYRRFAAERLELATWTNTTAPLMQVWASTMANAGETPETEDTDERVPVQGGGALQDGPVELVRAGHPSELLAKGEVRNGEVTLARMAALPRPRPAPKPSTPRTGPGVVTVVTTGGAVTVTQAGAERALALLDKGLPPDLAALIRDAERYLRGDDLANDGERYVSDVLREAKDLREALEEGGDYTTARQRAVRGWTQGIRAWMQSQDGAPR